MGEAERRYRNAQTGVQEYLNSVGEERFGDAVRTVRPICEEMARCLCACLGEEFKGDGDPKKDSRGENWHQQFERIIGSEPNRCGDEVLRAWGALSRIINPSQHSAAAGREITTEQRYRDLEKGARRPFKILYRWFFSGSQGATHFEPWKPAAKKGRRRVWIATATVLAVVVMLPFVAQNKISELTGGDYSSYQYNDPASESDNLVIRVTDIGPLGISDQNEVKNDLAEETMHSGVAMPGDVVAEIKARRAPDFGMTAGAGDGGPVGGDIVVQDDGGSNRSLEVSDTIGTGGKVDPVNGDGSATSTGPFFRRVEAYDFDSDDNVLEAKEALGHWISMMALNKEEYYGSMAFPLDCYYNREDVPRERVAQSRDKCFAEEGICLRRVITEIRVAWKTPKEVAFVVENATVDPATKQLRDKYIHGILMRKIEDNWMVKAEVEPGAPGQRELNKCMPKVFEMAKHAAPLSLPTEGTLESLKED